MLDHRTQDGELAAAQRRHRRVAGVDVHLLGAALGAHVRSVSYTHDLDTHCVEAAPHWVEWWIQDSMEKSSSC